MEYTLGFEVGAVKARYVWTEREEGGQHLVAVSATVENQKIPDVMTVTDLLMVFALGLLGATRAEMALRARRMLAEARRG